MTFLFLLLAADLSRSSVAASPPALQPKQTIDYVITLRNTGDESPQFVYVSNHLSNSALFVSSNGWEYEPADRKLTWGGPLPPGSSKELRLTLIAKPRAAGTILSNDAIVNFGSGTLNLTHSADVESPPTRGGLTGCGTGVAVFGLIFVAALVLAPMRAKVAVVPFFLGAGFLVYFAILAKEDLRALREFRETRCTILDGLVNVDTRTSSSSTPRSPSKTSDYTPFFAVRYDGRVSVTEPPASALTSRSAVRKRLRGISIGSTVPCWVDPRDPQTVTLERGFGGGYLFALIALLPIVIGIVLLRRAMTA